jgi:hypothetical protein
MEGVGSAKTTILFKFKFLRSILFVFGRRIIPVFALGAPEGNDVSHNPLPLLDQQLLAIQ